MAQINPYPLEQCSKCARIIPDDEWVINWGWCDHCFDRSTRWYFRKQRIKEWIRKWLRSSLGS